MFGMRMFVGGVRGGAFDAALGDTLRELGAVVLERGAVREWSARYEWARARASGPAAMWRGEPLGEVPSLAVHEGTGEGGERFLVIDVRGPRSPLWSLGLARRLSVRLGVWAAAIVNDRLRDDYGFGFFYAGHVIEAAARTISDVVVASGGDAARWFQGARVEEESHRRFFERAKLLAGIRDPHALFPASGAQVDVLALGAADHGSLYDADAQTRPTTAGARGWFEVAAAPVTRAVVVDRSDAHVGTAPVLASLGWEVDVHALPPSYAVLPDGSLDERESNVMALRGDARCVPNALLRALEMTTAAATVVRFGGELAGVEAWHREPGAPWTRTRPNEVGTLVAAYDPVTRAAHARPLAWDVGRPPTN